MSNSIDILDIIVRAAVQARVDYVERTQINKLYEIAWEFDVNKYPFKGINANEQLAYELILYMLRQSRRTKTIKTSRGSKNVSLISITGNSNSFIAKMSDIVLILAIKTLAFQISFLCPLIT